MRTFTDTTGTIWRVEITIGTIKRARTMAQVDLLELQAKADPQGLPLYLRLSTDFVLVCDILFSVCSAQAQEAGITDEDFGRAMGGTALLEGQRALIAELHDFFHQSGRTEVATALTKATTLIQTAITEAEANISPLDVASLTKSAIGKHFTGLRELSESTPTR